MPSRSWIAVAATVALALTACETSEVPTGAPQPTTTFTTEAPVTTQPSASTTAPPTTLAAVAEDGVLTIGSLLPETGSLASLGPPLIRAVELAVIDVNEAGGVLDGPVGLVSADSGSDAAQAELALVPVLDGRADVVVGPAVDGVTRRVFDTIIARPALSCLPATTSVELIARDDGGLAFRTAPADLLQMVAIADLVAGSPATTVALLAAEDEVGLRLSARLAAELADREIDVVLEQTYDPGAADTSAAVELVVESGPDTVVLLGGDEGPGVLRGLLEAGFAGDDVLVNDAIASPLLGELVDPANPGLVDGVRGTVPTDQAPLGGEFFEAAFTDFAGNIDTFFAAQAYDCVIVTALAAASTGASEPSALAGAIVEVTTGGTACSTFAECLPLIEEGTDIDYVGASGVDLDADGLPTSGVYDVFQFDADGTQQPIATVGIGPAAEALVAEDAETDGEGEESDGEADADDETDEG
ncbi:MAG: ABC transporter substrate-binding protein [Actinomycetota bacterium]